jgi:maltose O-acetyltransferase
MTQKTEYEKMLAGELYEASDKGLTEMRVHARALIHATIKLLMNKNNENCYCKRCWKNRKEHRYTNTFFCDYCSHIEIGDNFFANFNCVFLD